jgi:hypothetical protein
MSSSRWTVLRHAAATLDDAGTVEPQHIAPEALGLPDVGHGKARMVEAGDHLHGPILTHTVR